MTEYFDKPWKVGVSLKVVLARKHTENGSKKHENENKFLTDIPFLLSGFDTGLTKRHTPGLFTGF